MSLSKNVRFLLSYHNSANRSVISDIKYMEMESEAIALLIQKEDSINNRDIMLVMLIWNDVLPQLWYWLWCSEYGDDDDDDDDDDEWIVRLNISILEIICYGGGGGRGEYCHRCWWRW